MVRRKRSLPENYYHLPSFQGKKSSVACAPWFTTPHFKISRLQHTPPPPPIFPAASPSTYQSICSRPIHTILFINLPTLYESLLPLDDLCGPSGNFYRTPYALMHFTHASCHDNCNNNNLVVETLEYVHTTHTKKLLL